ncbi:neurexin-4 isoform X2, partial [Brachionus plicatilis]
WVNASFECTQPIPLGSENGILPDSSFTATSFSSSREPYRARLNGQFAWRPRKMDSNEYLIVNFESRVIITSVATQGRRAAREFVTLYALQYSDNGMNWFYYTDENKIIMNFPGNTDDNTVRENRFHEPIIAKYVRINPRQWNNFIALRVEFYGCPYDPTTVTFNRAALASYDAMFQPLNSYQDELLLRFRTNDPSALIFYTKGTQNNDYMSIELRNGSLYVGVDLGSTVEKPGEMLIRCGSLLDDFQWHDVKVRRTGRSILVVVDQLVVRNESTSLFTSFNFDGKMYAGGAPSHIDRGISIRSNFMGCLENVIYRSFTENRVIDILKGARYQWPHYQVQGGYLSYSCVDLNQMPMTFKDRQSYLYAQRNPGSQRLDVSFGMRTFELEGLLYHHRFAKDTANQDTGYIKVYLNEGALLIKFRLGAKQKPDQTMTHRRAALNDGLWHDISLSITIDMINVTVDFEPEIVRGTFKIQTGEMFYIGGGVHDDLSVPNFVGCFRRLTLNDGRQVTPQNVRSLKDGPLASANDYVISVGVLINSCEILDKCTPNPCQHGATCLQTWDNFRCDCSRTGYGGAVCHTSEHPLSCLDYKMTRMQQRVHAYHADLPLTIDVDGSGPIGPFQVTCKFGSQMENMNVTQVDHYSHGEIVVKGYKAPGSYSSHIVYTAAAVQLNELVQRSYACSQYVKVKCKGARFLNYPGEPFGWWVGRTNQPMYYWGGSEDGIAKCRCGVNQECDVADVFCNCDSGDTENERHDDGLLNNKLHLPVYKIFLGDTGDVNEDRYIKYSIGSLVCEGDRLYDNTVTFRKQDALLHIDESESGRMAVDVRFQFRTSVTSGILVQKVGNFSGDLIEVKLLTAREIAFRYSAGSGVQLISIGTPFDLNDNEWHTVQLERNRKEARMNVDSISAGQPEDLNAYRPFMFTSNLTIGAAVSYRDGFVGCVRGLQLNGKLIDLAELARRAEYGVSEGCVGKCASSPCLNNGTCVEQYSTFECDCTFTPFRGPICGTEIGTILEASNMIKYTFPTEGVTATEEETISAQFATYNKQGIIMQILSDKKDEKGLVDYFTLEMNNNGGVRVRFNYGFDNFEFNPPYDLSNGQNHELIVVRRNRGQSISIKVDEHLAYSFNFTRGSFIDMVFDSPRYLYVGRNDTMRPDTGFIGCVSRLQFNRIFPLKYAFLEVADADLEVFGPEIREWQCAIDPVTYAPEAVEIPPDRDIKIIQLPNVHAPPLQDWRYATLLGVGLAVLLATAFGFIIFFYHKYAYKGSYVTKEDKGAVHALDADEAITKGDHRHPNIAEKKEWFL